MGSLKSLKKELVHTRAVRMQTFAVDGERLEVEGVLEDDRPFGVHTISNQRREPGQVHGMTVRLLIGGMPSQILDAEAEMATVPLDGCGQAVDSVKKLVGMPIVYGFSKEVKERLSGIEGCNHLTSLILTMGSAAVQGMVAHRGRKPVPQEAQAAMLEYLKDTCCVWREDGDFYKEVSARIKDEQR